MVSTRKRDKVKIEPVEHGDGEHVIDPVEDGEYVVDPKDEEEEEEEIYENSISGGIVPYKKLSTYKASVSWENKWNPNNDLEQKLPDWLLQGGMAKTSMNAEFSGYRNDYICEEECHTKSFDINVTKVSKTFAKNKQKVASKTLQLYETYTLKKNHMHKIYANAGGPVWSMAWCPKPDFPQYLAVYTHKNQTQLTYASEKLRLKGCIQIWSFQKNRTFSLVMVLLHEFGPVFEMKWLPFHNTNENLLGLLAFCGCDEIVRIGSIPSLECFKDRPDKSDPVVYTELNIVANLLPSAKYFPIEKMQLHQQLVGNVSCITWSPFKSCIKLVAGYSNGFICVWDLDNENLVTPPQDSSGITNVHPRTIKNMIRSNINGVEFCPHMKDLVVVYGWDRKIYFVDINNPDEYQTYNDKYVAKHLKWAKYCSEPYILDLLIPSNSKNGFRAILLVPSVDQNEEETTNVNNDIDRDRLFCLSSNFSDLSICNYSGFIVAITFNGDCLVTNKNADFKPAKAARRAESCVYTLSIQPHSNSAAEESTRDLMDVNEIPGEKVSQLNLCTTEEWSRSIGAAYVSTIDNGLVFNEFDRFYKNQKGLNYVNHLSNPTNSDVLLNRASLNRVALNENLCCLGWMVTGGNAGILKLEDLSQYLY